MHYSENARYICAMENRLGWHVSLAWLSIYTDNQLKKEAKNCRAISPLTAFTIWVIMSYKIDTLFNHALPKTVWKVETHFSVIA